MLKRFDTSVLAEHPDLVLWQLGTNSVIRDDKLSDHDTSIRDGLKKIRAIGADAVLIDPQFAPKVIVKAGVASMVELIATTAKREDVDLFPRFNMMKHWSEVDHMAFETFVSPDGLHMNDWGYACMAKGLGMAIAEAAQRPLVSAKRCRIWCAERLRQLRNNDGTRSQSAPRLTTMKVKRKSSLDANPIATNF